MSFHRVARAGVLRHLHLGNGLGRSTNVIGVQQQLRQLSLTTRPRMTIPSVGALPRIGFQRLRAFATEDGPANEDKPAKKKTAAKKKSTKSKSKKKTTSKPKPKKKKKPLTEKGQERKKRSEQRAKINELKATALTEPKKLPTVWRHVAIQSKFAELNIPAGTGVEKLRFVNEAVKSLSSEEIERYQTQGEENRAANTTSYRAWVESYTPRQIRDANAARQSLGRITKKRTSPIKDDRLLKRPKNAYIHFAQERIATGDFKHMAMKDITQRISGEWNSLTESEKEPYHKKHLDQIEQYKKDHRELYGDDPRFVTRPPRSKN